MADETQIIAIADASPLIDYDWPERGPAPRAYVRGMAIAFSRALAMLRGAGEPVEDDARNPLGATAGDIAAWRTGKTAIASAAASPIGDPANDVLGWYEDELRAAGASFDSAEERLIAVFAILLGLGMRESSGEHCTGADTPESRGEPTNEENAEAGLFQVSHDSVGSNTDRQALFEAYRGRTYLLGHFNRNVRCRDSDLIDHGTGSGALFQRTMKQCPLFAVLYTAAFLRRRRSHWGPINRRRVEARTDAVALFREISRLQPDGRS